MSFISYLLAPILLGELCNVRLLQLQQQLQLPVLPFLSCLLFQCHFHARRIVQVCGSFCNLNSYEARVKPVNIRRQIFAKEI